MSRLEEALEQATKLKQFEAVPKEIQLADVTPLRCHCPYVTVLTQPESPINEEYRKLKSKMMQAINQQGMNTFMITSAAKGEGKTITAINLALSLVKEPHNSVLLIDCDVRNPSICHYLDIEPSLGLIDYFVGETDFANIIIKPDIENFYVIPAGQPRLNTENISSQHRMNKLIEHVKQQRIAKYTIIDTPPILLYADAFDVGHYVDAVLFVIKEGHTPIKKVQEALNILKNFTLLGIVFNNASSAPPSTPYYYNPKLKQKIAAKSLSEDS
jgi:capsular exopolysaccharide synthesis family protein